MTEARTECNTHVKTDENMTWPEFIGIEKYAYQMYRLQSEAGLSFKEARAVLTPQTLTRALAEEWGCSYENICNLARRGLYKVSIVANGDEDKILDLVPTRMSYNI
jgi:hypothetical protein